MIRVQTEDFSPSQIGEVSTRMSAASTFSAIAGQSSRSHPYSVMSWYTPVAMSWSTARIVPTATPLRSMMAMDRSARPCVCETSGERLSVQLMYRALRSEKSHRDSSHSRSCSAVSLGMPYRPPSAGFVALSHGSCGLVALPRRPRRGRRRVVVELDALVDLLKVGPELVDRRAPPEPVANVDLLDLQARREDHRVRDAGVGMVRVGVLVDVEGLLDFEVDVGEEGPVRAGGDAHLERVVQVVGEHGDDFGEGHRTPPVELDHLLLLLALARAVLAAAEHEDQAVVALQLRQAMKVAVLVGQFEVGQGHAGLEVLAHGLLLGSATPGTSRRIR